MRPGGVVLERTFAEALGVRAGDRITLNGRPFRSPGSRSRPPAPVPASAYWLHSASIWLPTSRPGLGHRPTPGLAARGAR